MALRLEIHHVDVSGGDCTIILLVDVTKGENDKITEKLLKSVMIDAGGVGAGPKKIVKYLNDPILKRFSDAKEMDYFIASHYHDDHIMGLAYIIKSVKFKQYVDIGSDFIPEKYSNVPAYEKGKAPAYYKNYLEIIRNAIKGKYTIDNDNEEDGIKASREHIPFISEKNNKTGVFDIYLDNGKEIILRCVAANGMLSNGTHVVSNQKLKSKRTVDPNDKSLAFFLTWTKKNFRYFTAGDLSGDPSLKHYYDIEGELLDYLTKDNNLKKELLPLTAMKINHHGSQRSSRKDSPNFLETLNPRVLLLSANQKKKVPNVNFLTDHLFPFLDKKSQNETMYLGVINNMAYRKSSLVGKGFEKVVGIDKKQLNTNITIENITVKKKAIEIFGNQRPGALIMGVGEPFDSNNLKAPTTIDDSFLSIKNFQLGMMPPITLTKEELEADAVVSRQYTAFELVIEKKYEKGIEEGLLNFFKSVIVMLNKDYENESGDVLEMIESDFPSAYDTIKGIKIPCKEKDIPTEAKKIATSAMTLYRKLFKITNQRYQWRRCWPEDCDEKELETLYNLLYGSPWQIDLNKEVFYLNEKNDLPRYCCDWPYLDKKSIEEYVRKNVIGDKKRKRTEESEMFESLIRDAFFGKKNKKNNL